MRIALLLAYVVGYAIASAWSGIQFKLAAQSAGKTALWYFVIGNLIGALCPVVLTLALRAANPNVIYALCYGGAFSLLQVVSWRMFGQPLSVWQWAGIALVGLGILLLQFRSA